MNIIEIILTSIIGIVFLTLGFTSLFWPEKFKSRHREDPYFKIRARIAALIALVFFLGALHDILQHFSK